MPDILFIMLLALVIFGPKKLPEIARQIGKWTLQFRRMSNEFRSQLEGELLKIEMEDREKKPQAPSAPPPVIVEVKPEEPPPPVPLALEPSQTARDGAAS